MAFPGGAQGQGQGRAAVGVAVGAVRGAVGDLACRSADVPLSVLTFCTFSLTLAGGNKQVSVSLLTPGRFKTDFGND